MKNEEEHQPSIYLSISIASYKPNPRLEKQEITSICRPTTICFVKCLSRFHSQGSFVTWKCRNILFGLNEVKQIKSSPANIEIHLASPPKASQPAKKDTTIQQGCPKRDKKYQHAYSTSLHEFCVLVCIAT